MSPGWQFAIGATGHRRRGEVVVTRPDLVFAEAHGLEQENHQGMDVSPHAPALISLGQTGHQRAPPHTRRSFIVAPPSTSCRNSSKCCSAICPCSACARMPCALLHWQNGPPPNWHRSAPAGGNRDHRQDRNEPGLVYINNTSLWLDTTPLR